MLGYTLLLTQTLFIHNSADMLQSKASVWYRDGIMASGVCVGCTVYLARIQTGLQCI